MVLLTTCLLIAIFTPVRGQDLRINSRGCGFSGSPRLIINGSNASPNQFPWMVRLLIENPFKPGTGSMCGGSIITRRHVLTAAHCVVKNGTKASNAYAFYGDNNAKRTTMLEMKKMLVHPSYNNNTLLNDIALILVDQPFQFSKAARPLCLPTKKMSLLNRNAIVAGWGSTKKKSKEIPDHLQYTILKIVHHSVCLGFQSYVSDKMLCTQSWGSSAYEGDSGGPLIVEFQPGRFVQVGVASYIDDSDTDPYNINVFARVEAYISWIKNSITKLTAYENFSPYDLQRENAPLFMPYIFSSDDTV